jgi:hypothetical protein
VRQTKCGPLRQVEQENHMGLNRIARGGREVLVLIIIALFRDCTVKPARTPPSGKGDHRHFLLFCLGPLVLLP